MKPALLLSCCTLLSIPLAAQDESGWREYIFVAPTPNNGITTAPTTFGIVPGPPPTVSAASSSTAYAGGLGAELRFNRWAGVGLEAAGLFPGTGKVLGTTVASFSPNGYLHWPQADWKGAKLDPYVTAGYSLLFLNSAASGFNCGGGLNYWFQERLGFMMEFRFLKVLGSNPPTPATNYYEIRVGFTFRQNP